MRFPILMISLVSCRGDSAIKVVNSPPSASITSPPDGSTVDEYSAVEFAARVSDDFDDDDDLSVVWSSDIDGEFAGPFPVDAGTSVYETANLSAGNHIVTVLVVDSAGDSARDSIELVVNDRPEAPVIAIVHPAGQDEIIEEEEFEFVVTVEDVQDSPESLSLTFTSDVDGTFCEPAADATGVARCDAILTPGDHLLTFSVVDSDGDQSEATTYWAVTPLTAIDNDGDGFSEEQGDCDDGDGSVKPGGTEFYNGRDDDCDGEVDEGTEGFDDDGDGYAEIDGDCDDDSDITYPGAEEICDSLDNDCDTTIDEGTTCYDDDGDGWREIDGDCDDADPTASPSGTETADGVDNDCDGIVDEGTVNYDDDGDGYAEIDGDCDDTDATVSPAGTEVCNDGVDNDCDGVENEENASGCTDYFYDYDGDGYGDQAVSGACLCSQSGYYTSAYQTDCNDLRASVNPAATGWQTSSLDGSYDYNCDGVEAKRWDSPTHDGGCSGAVWVCTTTTGWRSSAPACGSTGQWITNCSGFTCSATTSTRQQSCR